MKPFRLFVILAFLTASALAIVHLRVGSVRTAYRIQKLHARELELRQQRVRQEADIAALSTPQAVRELSQKHAGQAAQPGAQADWETD